MDFKTCVMPSGGLAAVAADALLVVIAADGAMPNFEAPIQAALKQALGQEDFAMKSGRTVLLHGAAGVKATRLLFVAAADASTKGFKTALGLGLGMLKNGGCRHLCVAVSGPVSVAHAQAMTLAVNDATYVYRQTKPSAAAPSKLQKVSLVCEKSQAPALLKALQQGQAVAAGVTLARELANRPGNHCTPTVLAEQAQQLAREWGVKVQVLERKALEKLGMGAFLAVAQGSDEAPKFIVAQYRGAAATQAPLVLIGKGITFDSGGISIKPSAEMDEMKFDMGGAASVLGALRAVAQIKPKLNLVVLVPTCENMPSGRAIKPGDVVTSMSGQTIEILNTDAEGRLILCDALTYAERFKPSAVVDVATLTGACMVALGGVRSGLFSPDDALAAQLLRAGDEADDLCWRLPLDNEYDEGLKSQFADVANVAGRHGGAITAAMFLKRFASAYPWAHLDVAGTAWKSGAAKGSTGRPVGLLTQFILSRAG